MLHNKIGSLTRPATGVVSSYQPQGSPNLSLSPIRPHAAGPFRLSRVAPRRPLDPNPKASLSWYSPVLLERTQDGASLLSTPPQDQSKADADCHAEIQQFIRMLQSAFNRRRNKIFVFDANLQPLLENILGEYWQQVNQQQGSYLAPILKYLNTVIELKGNGSGDGKISLKAGVTCEDCRSSLVALIEETAQLHAAIFGFNRPEFMPSLTADAKSASVINPTTTGQAVMRSPVVGARKPG